MTIPIDSIKMLSTGTGIPSWSEDADTIGEESRDWGPLGWIKHGLIDHLFSGNASAVEHYCKQALGDNCIRVNGPLTYTSSEMDDVSEGTIENLRRTGKEWYLDHPLHSPHLKNISFWPLL